MEAARGARAERRVGTISTRPRDRAQAHDTSKRPPPPAATGRRRCARRRPKYTRAIVAAGVGVFVLVLERQRLRRRCVGPPAVQFRCTREAAATRPGRFRMGARYVATHDQVVVGAAVLEQVGGPPVQFLAAAKDLRGTPAKRKPARGAHAPRGDASKRTPACTSRRHPDQFPTLPTAQTRAVGSTRRRIAGVRPACKRCAPAPGGTAKSRSTRPSSKRI